MPELTCPHCGKVFQVDESDYSSLVSQVKNAEFEKELHAREEVIKSQAKVDLEKEINSKNAEIEKLKANEENHKKEVDIAVKNAISEKDAKISELNQEIKNKDAEKELAVKTAVADKDAEIERLKGEESNLKGAHKNDMDRVIAEKDTEIQRLKEVHKSELVLKDQEIEEIKTKNAEKVSNLNDEIAQLRQYRQSRSVKDIGEDLEQYCKNEFEKVRQIGFKNAQFGKDNDATSGSKGDFIFRDFTEDGIEIVSIMFDMKDERDESANKHKNEDFLDKLDKDRKTKKCEYAILVSTLEKDNDLYNEGIVDVSHLHEKMYVIRPQFFIPMITLLRNAALTTIDEKRQNIAIKQENMDAATFQSNMQTFIDGFNTTFNQAKKRHWDAINEIDKIIDHLNAMKDALKASDKHLNSAKNKVIKNATVKNLTKDAPSVANELSGVSLQIPSFDSPEDEAKVDGEFDNVDK